MRSVPPIRTERLELVSLGLEFLDAVREGDLDEADRLLGVRFPPEALATAPLGLRRAQLKKDPTGQPWLLRAMVTRSEPREVVGHIGFHAPPDDRGFVEVGYRTLAPYRRRGYAEEAVRALFAWAAESEGVDRFRASVSPTNEPSLSLVRKLGFAQVGVQWDEEDGEELVFEREGLPPEAGAAKEPAAG